MATLERKEVKEQAKSALTAKEKKLTAIVGYSGGGKIAPL